MLENLLIIVFIIVMILFAIGFMVQDWRQFRRHTEQSDESYTSIVKAAQSVQDAMKRDEEYISLLQGYSNQLAAIVEDLTNSLDKFDLDRQLDVSYRNEEDEVVLTEYIGFPVILLPLKTLKDNIDAVIEEKIKGRKSRERIRGEMEDWGL